MKNKTHPLNILTNQAIKVFTDLGFEVEGAMKSLIQVPAQDEFAVHLK